jgi:hypothetical protein
MKSAISDFSQEPLYARNQPEWVQRFGAMMRIERTSCVNDPLPPAIAAKLQAIEDAEQRIRLRESECTPGKCRT